MSYTESKIGLRYFFLVSAIIFIRPRIKEVIFIIFISILIFEESIAESFYKVDKTFPSYANDHRFHLGACSIVSDIEGNIFLSNEISSSIYKYSKSGSLISSYSLNADLSVSTSFSPKSQVIDSAQKLYTLTNNGIYIFDKNLSLLELIKTEQQINGDQTTYSVAISPSDKLFYLNAISNNSGKYIIYSLDKETKIEFKSIDEKVILGFDYLNKDHFIVALIDNFTMDIIYYQLDKNGSLTKIFEQNNNQGFYSFSIDKIREIIYTSFRSGYKRIIKATDFKGTTLSTLQYSDSKYFDGSCYNKTSWIDKDGFLYIGGDNSATVKKISYQEGELFIISTWGDNNYFTPFSDIFASNNHIYIPEYLDNNLLILNKNFEKIDSIEIPNIQESISDNESIYYHNNFEVGLIDSKRNKNIIQSYIGIGFINAISLYENYLYIMDIGNNTIQKADKTKNYDFVSLDIPITYRLRDIAINKNGTIYINDGGTCIKDLHSNILFCTSNLKGDHPLISDLLSATIQDFKFSSNESIIFTTNTGIFEYNLQNNNITKIADLGLLPNQVRRPLSVSIDEINNRLYVADVGNNRIVVYSKVDRPDTSKAIILAGGDESGNTLWDEAQANANHAFWSLANQGYTKANMQYLNHNTDLDLDGNGEPDDVDGIPSLENIKSALTEWATEAVEGKPVEDVVLYMIGHGGDGTFELGNGEVLTASQLNAWLDELQAIMPGKVTVIYDGCQSGSFVPVLSDSDVQRTVMTSAQADQNAYFQDAISFSHLFWNQVFAGKTLSEAFQTTQRSISLAFPNQSPLMDSNGDGVTNSDEDYAFVSQQVIGNGTVYSGTAPVIGSVSLTPVDAGESTSRITVSEIGDEGGVQNAWGIVTPPYADLTTLGTPVQNLPRFDLLKQEDGSYQGSFDGFEQPGTYQVAIYAQDTEGNTSLPVVESINVISPLGRKALLVAGVDSLGQFSSAIQKQADHAYSALTGQGYADSTNKSCLTGDSICYLSANTVGTTGVDQALSKEGLEHFLTFWASSETSDLVVYLVGDVIGDTLQLTASESVSLSELRAWLDQAQSEIEGTLTVIHEGNGSGATVAALGSVGSETKRIVISSSAMAQGSYLPAGGDASFSRYFWGKVAQGGTVEEAFAAGSASLARFQTPQINANGNAFSNEKSDRYQARFHHLGLGILLAANEPVIGDVPLNTELEGGTSELLWADEIVSLSEIDKVWAVIEPPEYDPVTQQTGELIEVLLEKNSAGRWEATFDGFAHAGLYTVHYYAQDKQQRISPPRTSYVTQTLGPDAYESDDTPETAALLSAMTQYKQRHNFTDRDDTDYVNFDADPARGMYTIKVDSLESTADAAFSLYDPDLNPIALGIPSSPGEYTIDALFADSVELAYWLPGAAGRYTLKVQPADTPSSPSLHNGYTVSIFPTNAPHDASIAGIITNETGTLIEGALVFSDENQSIRTDAEGYYVLPASLKNRSITVEASGYTKTTQQIYVKETDQPTLDFILVALNSADNAEPTSPSIDTAPVIQAVKPVTTHYSQTHSDPIIVQSLQINAPAGGAKLHSLTINSLGGSNEATDIKAVTLYHDINQNQQIDVGDIQVGESRVFAANNGSIDLATKIPYLLKQGQQQLIVIYELH